MGSKSNLRALPKLTVLSIAWAWLLFWCAAVYGEEHRAPQTIEPGTSCVAPACHEALKDSVTVHRPVIKDGCKVCHEPDGSRHAFAYPFTGAELCYACHDSVTEKKYIHAPLQEEEAACTICHDPHVSAGKHLLRAGTTNALCLRCHADAAEGGLYHLPDEVEGCTKCHDPHSADLPTFLHSDPPGLCYSCHGDIKEGIAGAAVVHGPLRLGCDVCHDPHRERAGKGLREGGVAFCIACHEHFKGRLSDMHQFHPRLLEENQCLRCHDPHAGARESLLRDSPLALCLTCHEKNIERADGRSIEGFGATMGEDVRTHGPLAAKECGGCHEPHANAQFAFLRNEYPATFYSPYTMESYALCFGCHDVSLAANRYTTDATGFRNGSFNLHYLHVNRTRKGRTCRACHAPHTSRNPHFMRDSVPFGDWEIPIGFTQTENGGTCSPGCHLPKAYDRVNPVLYREPVASEH